MRILITVLFLLSFSFSSALNAEQSPWQLRENKGGIPVYTRKVAGSPILEYKANVIVNAPILKVIALFEDERQIRRWYFQCIHSELVENDGPKQKVIYLILRMPRPFASRDFIFRRTKSEDPASGTISYFLTALPDRLPLVKGMIRVQSIESVWCFRSLPKGRTEIYLQQHTNPGGSIPVPILNRSAGLTPYNSLKNLRKLITGKDA
jgi:hypothetical protein